MVLIRSLLFTVGLTIWTLCVGLIIIPLLVLPRDTILRMSTFWAAGVLWWLRVTVGIRHVVRGAVLPEANRQYIYAIKHQSAWETIAFMIIGPPFAGVLKEELKRIPIYGWVMARSGMVPIKRSAKGSALKSMLNIARHYLGRGRHLMIMPEGTRVPPGKTGTYHPGVFALYKYLKLPVVPVAHNAGVFWGRNSFLKRPGTITMTFLDPIEPGLDKATFLSTLEDRIETESRRLFEVATIADQA